MSISYIPEKVKIRLWGKAAGRCEYEGCNSALWLDSLTKYEFNTAYIAHIIADSPSGPRGDAALSTALKCDIENLMLLCDQHHRLIDKEDVSGHPTDRLRRMKTAHEKRVEIVTGIDQLRQSHILLYGANVGAHSSPISYHKATWAMLPDRYPAETTPLSLGMVNSSYQDDQIDFWAIESNHLRNMVSQIITPRLRQGSLQHISIFAVAPQPLLILLGYLLSDLPAAEVYQLHREPPDWRWQDHPKEFRYVVQEPSSHTGVPALVLSLSGTITDERIKSVLGNDADLWIVTIQDPNNDFLKSREQTKAFRQHIRILLDKIKARHGQRTTLHVFPAMPVALAVELGRIIMPKADLPIRIYDHNSSLGGFIPTFNINGEINAAH